MQNTSSTIAELYYEAMGNKDIAAMEQYLDKNVQFTAPMSNISGKINVIEASKVILPLFNTLEVRKTFHNEDHSIIIYDISFPEPIGKCRVCGMITVENGLITHIELFYDARPFDKNKN